jgi:acyl-coenzyme A thioesterase PaaI-like protein
VTATGTAKDYPPPGHLLRRLGISLLPDGHDETVMYSSMPLTPELFVGEHVRLAVVATMVDMAAGTMAVGVVQPDWTATFDLASHRIGDAEPGSKADGVTRLVRAGKNTVISESTVTAGGRPIVYAETTFSRLPHRPGTAASSAMTQPRHLGEGEEPIPCPLAELIGFRRHGPGAVDFDLQPLIRNSTGSIQGGVSGMALEQAALDVAGPGAGVDFLHVYYLSAARLGPYRAIATPLRTAEYGVTGRAELRDHGNGKLLAQGTFVTGR